MASSADFAGSVAVVTGAASGIGVEICSVVASRGGIVIGIDRAASSDHPWDILEADVSEGHAVEAAIQEVRRRHGRIDLLFNNAGIASTTSVLDCTVEEWDQTMAVNARGVFLGIKSVIPHMLERGAGAIVNTASVAGMLGLRDRAAYCASKGAVIALTKQVAIQFVDQGIRCNAVAPGTVDSPWVHRLVDSTDDPGATRAKLVARQPMGRLGTPLEIANAAVFLASPDAAYMTGTVLTIDGGIMAGI